MDNNMIALQNLYVSLGGSLTDTYDDIADGIAVGNYTVKPDIIEAIAQLAGSAGIELPKVSKSDNGDALMVVNGMWAKAKIPSQLPEVAATDEGQVLTVDENGEWVADELPDNEPLLVTFTVNQSTSEVTCDTTLADIKNAIKNNIPVYATSAATSPGGNPSYISNRWQVIFANTGNGGTVIFEAVYITSSLAQRWYIAYATAGLTAYKETITFDS